MASWWRRKSPEMSSDLVWPLDSNAFDYSAEVRKATAWAMSLGPEQVWNTQPYVRTVVTFLARNVAQLGVHVFRRVSDTERERVTDVPLAYSLKHPNSSVTTYELIFGLVADKALYDRAYWLIGAEQGQTTLTRIPPSRVQAHLGNDPLGPIQAFAVLGPRGERVEIPARKVLYFPGWNPTSSNGLPDSPLNAIKSVIAEQAASFEFRKLAWANGLQTSQTIERPAGTPWKDEQRDRFIADVRSQFSGKGPRRNGVLLLEDGMKLASQQFSGREAQWVDAAKLSLALIAAIYHVNPTMVGLLDNANYSNVREFRKMLYGDTLGPIIASIEDRINTFLMPQFDSSGELYVEFNIAEKLQGNFEEQASALQTSIGGPWMTRAEGRALLNLPPIEGTDELIVPMNVTQGGQPSPTSPGEGTASAPAHRKLAQVVPIKAAPHENATVMFSAALVAFFDKQSRAVLSRIGVGDPDFYDSKRWDDELSSLLLPFTFEVATSTGKHETKQLGYPEADFDSQRATAYLAAKASSDAENINATTKQQLDDQLASDEPEPAHVFDVAKSARAATIATTLATWAAGFGTTEAAQQLAQKHDIEPMKVWHTGPNSREAHAAMNGQAVPLDQPFSNGMQWPAEAGCNCSVSVVLA